MSPSFAAVMYFLMGESLTVAHALETKNLLYQWLTFPCQVWCGAAPETACLQPVIYPCHTLLGISLCAASEPEASRQTHCEVARSGGSNDESAVEEIAHGVPKS